MNSQQQAEYRAQVITLQNKLAELKQEIMPILQQHATIEHCSTACVTEVEFDWVNVSFRSEAGTPLSHMKNEMDHIVSWDDIFQVL